MSLTLVRRLFPLLAIIFFSRLLLSASLTLYRAQDKEIVPHKEIDKYSTSPRKSYVSLLVKLMGFRGKFSYSLGQRIVGDQLLTQFEGGENYLTSRDIEVILRYPKSGTESTVTYVNIMVDQSSDIGNAYILDGGIREKFIELLVVANSTTKFFYSAVFYGY